MKLKPWTHGNGWMTPKQRKTRQAEIEAAHAQMEADEFQRAIYKFYLRLRGTQKRS